MKLTKRTSIVSSPVSIVSIVVVAVLVVVSQHRGCDALYDSSSDVVQTFSSSKEFRKDVLESRGVSLIQFYAPWCGHCQKFKPLFEKVATLLDGLALVGAIDASVEDGPLSRLSRDYNVQGFPTLKLFRPSFKTSNKNNSSPVVTDLNSRDVKEIINAVLEAMQKTIQDRATGSASGSSSSGSSSSSNSHNAAASSKVIELTSANFSERVYADPSKIVAVAFIAPWCGHCKNLLPEWEAAAAMLDDDDDDDAAAGVMLATVDATAHTDLAAEFGVRGYPTIKLFPGSSTTTRSASDAVEYQGGRTKELIVKELLDEVDRSGRPKEIPELTSDDSLRENCEKKNVICVLVALPHILDTGAAGRRKYRDVVTRASKAVRGMKFKFLWFEGGHRQTQLETALELTFGFPAVAAYSADKGVYVVHRGSFSEVNLRKFLMSITTGKLSTYPIQSDLVVVNTEPWDGLDGTPIEEEPLDDFWNDDDDDDEDDEAAAGEL